MKKAVSTNMIDDSLFNAKMTYRKSFERHGDVAMDDEPILTDEEKEYLEAVLKPFRNRVSYVERDELRYTKNFCYILITLDDEEEFNLPIFKTGTMYKGMENNKRYTLKELGLFEDDK